MTQPLIDTALQLQAAGHSVLPIRTDGSKAPSVAWKSYIDTPASPEQLSAWFAADVDGLGIITGRDGFVMLEAEGRAVKDGLVEQLANLMNDSGLGELWQRLITGWTELTPSGGVHWHARIVDKHGQPVDVGGNTKLARRPGTEATPVEVLFETRGVGGFTVLAPSAGRTHPTGAAWLRVAGGPETVAVLSVEDYDALRLAMSTFDQMPTPVAHVADQFQTTTTQAVGARPGDDYNARATWDDLLIPRGWTKGGRVGESIAWIRPGKSRSEGISATTGKTINSDGADRLYVFSTSTEFESERPYDKFSAYALLEHAGNHSAAASALRKAGYGAPAVAEIPVRHLQAVPDAVQVVTAVDGSNALAPAPVANSVDRSDDGNAQLLVRDYGHLLRHCADRGRWYAWDGVVWRPCPKTSGTAREYAKRVARALPAYDRDEAAWKRKSLSAIGVSNMLIQAATDPSIAVEYGELDAHAWDLNTPGGIVDLRTGTVAPSDQSRLHTRLTTCAPDSSADRTVWLDFLAATFNSDADLIAYMQRLVGYSAVGVVGPHVLPYCYGQGGNGKGVFLETVIGVLGDYATTAPSGFLMAKQFQGHETEIARLAGARMVVCSEVNDDDRFDEARVKQLTGGDKLTARFMAQDHFTFTPTHQLWAMGNFRPGVRAGGKSFWRRLRLIPFEHTVPDDRMIDDLQGLLIREHGPAILSWIIEGAVAYAQQGLRDPSAVLAATDDYQRDQDTVSRFIDDCCHLGGAPHVQTKAGIVYAAYESYCRADGDTPVSAKAFGMEMRRRGIDVARTRSAKFYTGITIMSDHENDGEDESKRDRWGDR